jgi:hypothetical protein
MTSETRTSFDHILTAVSLTYGSYLGTNHYKESRRAGSTPEDWAEGMRQNGYDRQQKMIYMRLHQALKSLTKDEKRVLNRRLAQPISTNSRLELNT